MNEGFRNLAVLLWALCAVNSNSYAQDGNTVITEEAASQEQAAPTIIYGAAKKSATESDEVVVEQPEGSPNPLGNPIPDIIENRAPDAGSAPVKAVVRSKATETEPQSQAVVPVNPNLGKDFQNTLLEANGMVYDVQAYPEQDLKVIGDPANPQTIYSPNVNP